MCRLCRLIWVNIVYKCINSFRNKPWFLLVCSTSLFKTLREKEKLLVTSNFSFSHSVFNRFGELSAIFKKFESVICKHSVPKSLKFVVWESAPPPTPRFFFTEHGRFVLCKFYPLPDNNCSVSNFVDQHFLHFQQYIQYPSSGLLKIAGGLKEFVSKVIISL